MLFEKVFFLEIKGLEYLYWFSVSKIERLYTFLGEEAHFTEVYGLSK